MVRCYQKEESPPGKEEDMEDLFRIKANQILRRLKELSWLDVESRNNFSQFIVLPHYSSRILGVLKNLCEARSVEYQRYSFITYQLLTGEEAKTRPGMVILQAEETSQQFLEELLVLLNNMKNHMELVARTTTFQEVLIQHFDEYKTKIVDLSYHRLKTSDHVARYRRRILETIQSWRQEREWLDMAIEEAVRSELFKTREEAAERLLSALYNIEEVYNGLDEVFNQIDTRHHGYIQASLDRARYLSQQGQRMDQHLAELLDWINRQETQGKEWQLNPDFFRLQRVQQLAAPSLYTMRKKRAPLQPEIFTAMQLPESVKAELRQGNLERLRRAITREKVNAWVLAKLGERQEMSISELMPETLEEFVFLHFVYLYGYDEVAAYRLLRTTPEQIAVAGPYFFQERRIVRVQQGKG